MKLTERLTGEMQTNVIEFSHVHGSLLKRTKTRRSDQSKEILYLLGKETMHLWRTDLWVVKAEEITGRIRVQFSSVQSLSRVRLFGTPWITESQASLSITNSRSSLRHRISDAIQPSHPLSSPSPPTLNPSQHQNLFQWVNSSHEVAKVLEFQL